MAYTIDISDQCLPAVQRLKAALSPARLNPAIGAAEARLFQDHFAKLPANKMGFPTTGFWKDAARSTNFLVLADGIAINVSKQGVRQRLQGGDIYPTGGKKYLTIPARSESYGKRAGEFNNLQLAFHRVGGKVEAFALVEAAATQVKIGKPGKTGQRKVTVGDSVGGGVYFWLVKSAHQNPDPTVIPTQAEIIRTAEETATSIANRAEKEGRMSVILKPMELLQPDFAARLQTLPYFANIAIGAPRVYKEGDRIISPKTIEDKISRSLNGLLATGGKAGASVRVLQPSYRVAKPNLPGPQGVAVLLVRCEVHPIINFGANGTNKYVSEIAIQVLRAGHDFHMDGVCSGLYADEDCFLPYYAGDDNLMTVDVLLTAKCPLTPRAEVLKPIAALNAGVLTLSCGTANAVIWYTLDGSFPADPALVSGSTASQYNAPFPVNSGDVIRFAGYLAPLDGSSTAFITIP